MPRSDYLGEFEEIVLLAVARLPDEAYGMRVRREIEARTARAVSIGAVYATLERLADKAFVRMTEAPVAAVERDRRARRFFRLAPAGLAALDQAEGRRAGLRAGLKLTRTTRA
jgi:PadR family transcriptional regulator PadR